MMSIFRRAIFVILALLLSIQLLPTPSAHANEGIVFGDSAVEETVRSQLALPSGPITEENMKSLVYLELPQDANIKSLQGLEYAINLYNLQATYNQIEDLTPISRLTQLTTLNLSNNLITDLTPLASLPELRTLNLQSNPVKDISPLSGAAKLDKLLLYRNEVTDVSPLASIASLKYVDVTGNYLDVKAPMNQAALDTLAQRQVTVLGITTQRKPPYVPKITWTKMFDDEYIYEPSEYAYGNGIYVTPEQYTSTDGIHWTRHISDDKDRSFRKVVFGKGLFLGIGHGSNHGIPVWSSKDGVNWSEATVIQMGANFRDVVYTGKRFVVISDDTNDYNIYDGVLATSEDGLTWKVHPNRLEPAYMLASGNGVLFALTDKSLYKSNDGITWKKTTVPFKGKINAIYYVNGKFVAAATGGLLYSKDGTKWTVTSMPRFSWGAMVSVKDRLFVYGTEDKTDTSAYMTSKDGKSWTQMTVPGNDLYINHIKFENSKYVARSYSGDLASTDGVTWKLTKVIDYMPTIVFNSTVGDGKLVGVGGYDNSWGFFRMDNAGKVTYRTVVDGQGSLNDVIWTGKQFVAVGDKGLMMTSNDGIKWTRAASPTKESMNRIIRAKDTYYIVGSNGLILTSKDMKTWKKHKTNTDLHLTSIAWSGSTFVAVGSDMLQTVALTSDNGTNWKTVAINRKSPDGSPALNFSDVAWGNGTFVITAKQNYHLDLPYTVFVSSDGKQWKKVGSKFDKTEERDWSTSLYGVHYSEGKFIAVGNNGSVYLSTNGTEWGREEIPDSEQLFSAHIFNGKVVVASAFTGQIYIGEFKE